MIAVTGASGALYAVRLLKAGLELGLELHLVASDYGKRLLIEECGLNLKTTSIPAWLDERYGIGGAIRHRGSALDPRSRRDAGLGFGTLGRDGGRPLLDEDALAASPTALRPT